MHQYHKQYPQYEWNMNKGYGTPRHKKLIELHGPCDLHRRSFNPVNIVFFFFFF